MISLVLMIIGFFMASGTFGASVINAFILVQYWLWCALIIQACLAIFILTEIAGYTKFVKYTKFVNYSIKNITLDLSKLFSFVASSIIYLWLSYFIINNASVQASIFSDFSGEVQFSILMFFVLLFINIIRK